MTKPSRSPHQLFTAHIGEVAATALAADFARDPGPKTGLVINATPESPVLKAAIDALTPTDTLTVVPPQSPVALRAHVAALGSWVHQRVRVVDTLAEADPADAVIVADLITGSADEVRELLNGLNKHLNPGGTINVAVTAAQFPPAGAAPSGKLGLAGAARDELNRQAALYGVGSELVVRNVPPVRVHRLRYSAGEVALADRLAPLTRTSSVRLTRGMHLDSNGVAAAALCLGAAVLARRGGRGRKLWLLPALAAGPVAAFFRDPEREVPADAAAVVAASDGKVLGVERIRDDRLGPAEYLRISVFLSVLDVHVNRAPVPGRVIDYFVVDGGFAAAMKPAAEHNVAAYTVLETSHGTVAVAQRTGLIARRIVQRAPVGALLAKGERFGLIRFGSRTDVYLPVDSATAIVAPGDRVVGGETVIARWR